MDLILGRRDKISGVHKINLILKKIHGNCIHYSSIINIKV